MSKVAIAVRRLEVQSNGALPRAFEMPPAVERYGVMRHRGTRMGRFRQILIVLTSAACSGGPRDGQPAMSESQTLAVALDSSAAAFYASLGPEYETERRAIAGAPRRVTRTPGMLRITARNGRVESFTDATAHPDSHVVHFYTQFLPTIDAHVVRAQYYEGWGYALVNDSTGRITAIEAVPVIAPGNERFVVASLDLDANYNANSIEIWRVIADSVAREFAADGGDVWGPDSVVWISPDTVRFVRTVRNRADYTDAYFTHIIARRDSGWEIEPLIP